VRYHYAVGKQTAEVDGAAALITIAKPTVVKQDWHSLAEIALQSADGQQVVEVGWTVDRLTNGDSDPHLFVFNWVDGGPTCYNECGFIPARGASIKPGDTLPYGVTKNFGIQHLNGAWWIAYDSEWIGAFPDRNWNGRFPRANLVQVFGEVASSSTRPCSEMGNGETPTPDNAAAAKFSTVMYVNGPPVVLSLRTIGDAYSTAKVTDRTFRYGGPGTC
jgi:hypothetical protein